MCSGAELVDDRRARRGLVAEHAAPGAARELRDDVAAESRRETSGTARSSTMPIISQWPVTESLPADASAMRPYAPRGREPRSRGARERRSALLGVLRDLGGFSGSAPGDRGRALRSVGTRSGTCLAMLPTRVAALIAVRRRVRQLADADAVHDDDDGAREGRRR